MIALVRVASTANIASLSGLLTVDGVTVSAGNRVLVKNQSTPSQNGIYVAASGSWSRASDTITAGLLCYVQEGTDNAYQSYVVTTANPITVGSTSIAFTPEPSINPLAAMGIAIGGATAVQDITAATISSNNLAFPDNANAILVGAGTINTVSNVKPGAVYQLIATGNVIITHNASVINCGGVSLSLVANDIVQILGLESNKVSVITAPHAQSEHFDLDVNGNARITGSLNLGGTAGSDNATIKVESDGSNLTLTSDIGGQIRFETTPHPDPEVANARSWDMVVVGRGTYYHFLQVNSGIQDGFAHQADHSHIEQNIRNPLTPAMKGITQLLRGNPLTSLNSVTLSGKPDFMNRTLYSATEHSIDTTATTATGDDYKATVKLRFTNSVSLPLNTAIQLESTGPVAGIQAANYSGKVTQAPTLVSSLWEVLVEVAGFDPEHWEPAIAESTALFNKNWALYVVASSGLPSNTGLTARYQGRPDQLYVQFTSPHGLNWGEAVVINVISEPTGMTHLTARAHSCYVSKVISPTEVAIVTGDIQEAYTHLPMTGSTTDTGAYQIYRGNVDPPHQVVLGSQHWTFWRDQYGVTNRYQIGFLTEATAAYSAAYGIDIWNSTANSVEMGFGNDSKARYSVDNIKLISPTLDLECDTPRFRSHKSTLVQDTKVVAISSNNLAFPDDANVILVGAGTINTVSNVKTGAVYHLVATGSITLTDGSLIVCKGGNVTLATDESVTVIGLESNKISVIS